jgi:tetratricopeptide (TPR) repeat protein
VVRRIQSKGIAQQLAAAIDDWSLACKVTRKKDDLAWKDLLAIARAADPDPWRNRIRDAIEQKDLEAMRELAVSEGTTELPAQNLARLGGNLREMGAIDEAVALLRKAQQDHPGDFWINHELASCLDKIHHPIAAIRFYTAALAIRPRSPGVHHNLGNALKANGALDEAIAAYRRAISLKSDFAITYNELGIALKKKGAVNEALAAYEEAIRLKPDYAPAYNNLGAILADKKGALDEAIAAYKQAIRLKADEGITYGNLGLAFLKKGAWDEAIAAYKQAIRLMPAHGDCYNCLGFALAQKGLLDEAIAAYKDAIRLKPDDAMAHGNLGGALDKKGALDEAIAAWKECIRLRQDMDEAYNMLGITLRHKGALHEAVAAFKQCIHLNPSHSGAYYNLGNVLIDMNALDEAVTAYKKVICLDPDSAGAYNQVAWILATSSDLRIQNPEQAVRLAKKAVALAPQVGECWNTLGIALYRARQWQDAVEALEKSMQLQSAGDSFHWFFLAMAYRQLGNSEKARHWYDRAVQWMDKNKPKDDQLCRFRAEAVALLGIQERPSRRQSSISEPEPTKKNTTPNKPN